MPAGTEQPRLTVSLLYSKQIRIILNDHTSSVCVCVCVCVCRFAIVFVSVSEAKFVSVPMPVCIFTAEAFSGQNF